MTRANEAHWRDQDVGMHAPEPLAQLAATLSSTTRLAVLRTLMQAGQPLHINEIARRVGVDASPVRGHLEQLVKAELARETASPGDRVRTFAPLVEDVRIQVRARRPARPAGPVPKAVARLRKQAEALERDAGKTAARLARTQAAIERAWARASPKSEA